MTKNGRTGGTLCSKSVLIHQIRLWLREQVAFAAASALPVPRSASGADEGLIDAAAS